MALRQSFITQGTPLLCLQCLIRRGGIKEKAFHCPETPFLLFPTGFHSDESLLKPDTAAVYHKDLIWDPKDATQIPVKGYALVCTLQCIDVHHVAMYENHELLK